MIDINGNVEQEPGASPWPVSIPAPAVTPDVSICIVNWNCCDYLRSLLTSIRVAGSELAVEVIVVDNASTDASASMVSSEFPEVHLIRNARHQAISRANNQAASRARGRLLFFLNNDTRIQAGTLTRLVRFVDEHPDVAVVAPRLISPGGKSARSARGTLRFQALLHRVWFLRWTRIFRSADRSYRQVNSDVKRSGYVEQVAGAALLVRRREFMNIGGWDEKFEFYMEEVDVALRLGRCGRIYYLAEAEVVHWGGVATRLDETYSYRSTECSYIHFIRKYYGSGRAQMYKVLVTVDMPLRVIILFLTWVIKRLFGSRERAARNYSKLIAARNFLIRGLSQYWRC